MVDTSTPRSRAAATAEAIEKYMLEQQLEPGDALPTEAELCERLGVSRSSVREALQRLQALDIVSVRQGSGAVVGGLSLQPLVRTLVLRNSLHGDRLAAMREVVATRRVLDLGLGRKIVMTFAGKPHPDLHALVDEMERLARQGERFFDADMAFHRDMLQGVRNGLLEELTTSMWLVHMAALPLLPPVDSEGMMQTALAHREILLAAERGDALGYLEAVERHYAPLEEALRLGGAAS